MMKINLFLTVGVLAAVLSNARAFTKEEAENIEKEMIVHVKKCSEKFGISDDDLKEAKSKKDADGVDPCFLACVFKSSGVINEEGMFDQETAVEETFKFVGSDDDKAKIKEIATECAKVNDEKVSDDKEGCERSKLLLDCFGKYKEELIPTRRR